MSAFKVKDIREDLLEVTYAGFTARMQLRDEPNEYGEQEWTFVNFPGDPPEGIIEREQAIEEAKCYLRYLATRPRLSPEIDSAVHEALVDVEWPY